MKSYFAIIVFLLFLNLPAWAQNPVPNSGFESWTLGEPDQWSTNNLAPNLITVESTADSHTGTMAAKAQVVDLSGTIISPFLSAHGLTGTGFPVQHAYTTFQCWYKATLAGSDAFIVTVVMYDDSLHAIGSADIAIRTSTSTFTMLTIPIDYPVHSDVSTCIIQFIAADTNGAVVAHNGTSFVVDDVELTGLSSIADLPLLNTVQVFPNPAHDQIFISAEGYFAGTVSLILTNMQGREVYRNEVFHSGQPERKMEVNLPDLPSGIYFLNIRKGEAFATQKLMIVDCL